MAACTTASRQLREKIQSLGFTQHSTVCPQPKLLALPSTLRHLRQKIQPAGLPTTVPACTVLKHCTAPPLAKIQSVGLPNTALCATQPKLLALPSTASRDHWQKSVPSAYPPQWQASAFPILQSLRAHSNLAFLRPPPLLATTTSNPSNSISSKCSAPSSPLLALLASFQAVLYFAPSSPRILLLYYLLFYPTTR